MTSKKIYLIVFFLSVSIISFAQGSIKGKIRESITGQALPGASVFIKNSTKGTATDLQGEFLINNVKPGVVEIVVNYLGYESKTISLEVKDKNIQKAANYLFEQIAIFEDELDLAIAKFSDLYHDSTIDFTRLEKAFKQIEKDVSALASQIK
jgi:hypothetical protein